MSDTTHHHYPDDAFSRPPVDRLDLLERDLLCSLTGSTLERESRYLLNETQSDTAAHPRWLRWRVTPKQSGDNAALAINTTLRRQPVAIRLSVQNRSDRPLHFTLLMNESLWLPTRESRAYTWRLGDWQTVQAGEQRDLTFALAERVCDQHPDVTEVLWPARLVLYMGNLAPMTEHLALLSRMTILWPEADLRDASLLTPSHWTSGRSMQCTVRAQGARANADLSLELWRGGYVLWRDRLTAHERNQLARSGQADVRRTLPWWIGDGPASVVLVCDGLQAPTSRRDVAIRGARQATLPLAERRSVNGRPTFLIDGRPVRWGGYSSYDYQPGSVGQFGAHGCNVFCVPVAAGRHTYNVSAPTWIEPNRFDFGEIEERVGLSLQANPEGWIMLRVSLCLPPFWFTDHSDQQACIRADGKDIRWFEQGYQHAASLASETWRRDQESALRRLLRWCRQQPWANRLCGVWLACATTEEWFHWACNDQLYADYSRPARQAFRAWAAGHSLPDTRIPEPRERACKALALYPDDTKGQMAAAYHRFLSELTVEAIAQFARAVKEETDGRCLVGVFHGYIVQLAGEFRQATAGHYALQEMLRCPDVDWLAGVPLLNFRDLTNGFNPYCSATESIALAGKLYCNENDLFSWLHPLHWHTPYDPDNPRKGAITMHWRECANDAVHGAVSQRFSLACSWHADEELHKAFTSMYAVSEQALRCDRTSTAEVAFCIDDTTFAWLTPHGAQLRDAIPAAMYHLGRSGAPVGVWLMSDLDNLPDHIRVVVLANAWAVSARTRMAIRRLLTKGGRTVLAFGPAGLIDPATYRWQADGPADLLQMPLRLDTQSAPQRVTLPDGVNWTGSAATPPRIWCEPATEGRYDDGHGAVLSRDLPDGGRLIWFGTPPLHTGYCRRLLEQAGVHLYAPENCVVHASRDLTAITAATAGTLPLHWPVSARRRDLIDGMTLTGQVTPCRFEAGQTRLFRRL